MRSTNKLEKLRMRYIWRYAVSTSTKKKREYLFLLRQKKEASLYRFENQWGDWFGTRQIPFEDWSDICEEGLALTLEFIESDLEDHKEMEGYKRFYRKVGKRRVALYDCGRYTSEEMFAWNDMGY